jgi:hypothetical protein
MLFARNSLLKQAEFQERLAKASVLARRVATARDAGDDWGWRYWGQAYTQALAEMARDLDGLYGEAEIGVLASRSEEGEAVRRATVTIMAGAPGRGRTLEPHVIRAAVRSLALRPVARDELNRERAAGYRVVIRGHEHTPLGRDRGVSRADEMVAAEINEHGRTADWVEGCREKLRGVVAVA